MSDIHINNEPSHISHSRRNDTNLSFGTSIIGRNWMKWVSIRPKRKGGLKNRTELEEVIKQTHITHHTSHITHHTHTHTSHITHHTQMGANDSKHRDEYDEYERSFRDGRPTGVMQLVGLHKKNAPHDATKGKNYRFYSGRIASAPDGTKIDVWHSDKWAKDYQKLEEHHGYSSRDLMRQRRNLILSLKIYSVALSCV